MWEEMDTKMGEEDNKDGDNLQRAFLQDFSVVFLMAFCMLMWGSDEGEENDRMERESENGYFL